jgi:hypothetical protein
MVDIASKISTKLHFYQDELDKQWFAVLDDLREGGTINMFGAPRHLVETYDVPQEFADAICIKWMEQFGS